MIAGLGIDRVIHFEKRTEKTIANSRDIRHSSLLFDGLIVFYGQRNFPLNFQVSPVSPICVPYLCSPSVSPISLSLSLSLPSLPLPMLLLHTYVPCYGYCFSKFVLIEGS